MPIKQRTAGIVVLLLIGAGLTLAAFGTVEVGWDYDPPLGMTLWMFDCGLVGAGTAFGLMYAIWRSEWERFIDEVGDEYTRRAGDGSTPD